MAAVKKRIRLTITLLVAVIALTTGLFVAQHVHQPKQPDLSQFHGTWLEQPRAISAFSMTGIDGKPFNNQSLKGHWTMVFLGFTHCGYLCPTSMAELAKMYRLLEQRQVKPLMQVVMISVDPERDDLPRLASYVKSFDPHFFGARGEQNEVKKMAKELGIAYAKVISSAPENEHNYDIQHSGAVILFNPQGELNGFFTTPHQAEALAKDYQLLVG